MRRALVPVLVLCLAAPAMAQDGEKKKKEHPTITKLKQINKMMRDAHKKLAKSNARTKKGEEAKVELDKLIKDAIDNQNQSIVEMNKLLKPGNGN